MGDHPPPPPPLRVMYGLRLLTGDKYCFYVINSKVTPDPDNINGLLWPAGIVADANSESGLRSFFNPWVRDVKRSRFGIQDRHPGSYFRELSNFLGVKNT
jgi:hypothetical protein